jgi:hypothetical protein
LTGVVAVQLFLKFEKMNPSLAVAVGKPARITLRVVVDGW